MTALPTASTTSSGFRDGLGERALVFDRSAGDSLETLRLRPEMGTLEGAIRDRLETLASFRHPRFATARAVERLPSHARLTLVSEYVPGLRVSEVIELAREREVVVDINAALYVVRRLLAAVAALHAKARVAHGAIAPERLVITPRGQLVIVEHALGAAIERLHFSGDRLWRDLRVAMPIGRAEVTCDPAADITACALVALALILGRVLEADEYPGRIGPLVRDAVELSAVGTTRPLGAGVRQWLERALPVAPAMPFADAGEARSALDTAVSSQPSCSPTRAAFVAFLERLGEAPEAPVRQVKRDAPAPARADGVEDAPPRPAGPAVAAPGPIRAAPPIAAPVPSPAAVAHAPIANAAGPIAPVAAPVSSVYGPLGGDAVIERSRISVVTPAGARAAAAGGTGLRLKPEPGGLIGPKPDPLAPSAIRLKPDPLAPSAIRLKPDPAAPGGRRSTPEAGARGAAEPPAIHSFPREAFDAAVTRELAGGASRRHWLRAIAAAVLLAVMEGGVAGTIPWLGAATHEPPAVEEREASVAEAPAEPITRLEVATEPAGAQVRVDGQVRGAAPLTITDLAPGRHTVVVESGQGSVRRVVRLEAGETASLLLPIYPGWIAVFAPVELQMLERGQSIGTSESGQIMLPPGRHEIELANELLAYRETRAVDVLPGKVAALSIELPTGVLHVNASPWAEVWIDGQKVGETPLGNLAVPIGTREIVFRHPELGERRHFVTVTLAAPARVHVDLMR